VSNSCQIKTVKIEIIEKPLSIAIYGFSGTVWNKDYAGMAFKLSGKMWQVVKGAGIKNKGKNIWVYDQMKVSSPE